MGEVGSVAQVKNAIDANQLPDMSGWVDVEMPEEESNRVGSKGAERLDKLASQSQDGGANAPAADSASLVERLYATAMRKTDGANSSESLRRALGVAIDGKIKKKAYADLDKCRMAACNAMNDLDSLTGREIASAEDGEGQPDAKAVLARALLDDAVAAQQKYAEKLGELANSLPKRKAAQKAALLQLKDRALRRADAITNLHKQLKDAAGKADGTDNGYDKSLLDRRGHTDGIYLKEARQSKGQKAPLTSDKALLDDALGSEALATEYARLCRIYQTGGGNVRRREVLCAAAHNIIDAIKPPSSIIDAFKTCERMQKDERKAPLLMSIFPAGKGDENGAPVDFGIKLGEAFFAFKASLSRYVDAKLGAERADEQEIAAAAQDLKTKIKDLNGQLEAAKKLASTVGDNLKKAQEPDKEIGDALKKVCECADTLPDWDSHIEDVKRLCSDSVGLDETFELPEDDRLALLEGTRRLSTAVEAQVWKETDHHDKELDGAVLIGCKPLGKGAFNAVKLCTFAKPDGTTVQRVFRPDRGARKSIKRGAIAFFLSQPGDFSGFSYSRASECVATVFGCEDVFPRTTFGALNGEPGMFLEVAPGREGTFFRDKRPKDVHKDPLGEKQGVETAGKIARKLNRLQWLDVLTGQVDRHMDNLMIGTGADGDVSVKGIDNDECFPDTYLGDGLLVFDDQMEAFGSGILGEGYHKLSEVLSVKADLSSSPMLDAYVRNTPQLQNKFIVDISKLPIDARIKQMERFKSFGLPDHIDGDLCRKLQAMTPEVYAKSLKGQNLTEKQIVAAVARFCLVRDNIDREREPKVEVYDAGDWTNVGKLNKINGKNTKLDGEIDDLLKKTGEKFQRQSKEWDNHKKNTEKKLKNAPENVKEKRNLDVVKGFIKNLDEQFIKDKVAILKSKRTISSITSNYYARVGCHRYLGLEGRKEEME